MKSTNQKNQTNSQCFGNEWKKEMMKMEKENIVTMYQLAGLEWLKSQSSYILRIDNLKYQNVLLRREIARLCSELSELAE